MSTTIDSKVVEMRFDNRHFENNVSTTMSTLDKLKQKLNFSGATKGLENVGNAAKNVNMNGLGTAVEGVQAKFSAMQVVGVTALANITNSAVNAGKRILSALTIDPVKTGFSEYEMKMDSIKTIVNSTGRDLADVNKLLEELNEYSDQTIYSFRDMTQNIGKFTNAGVGLEDAVLAIKGISNEAAVSGANAQEASRAMYNFSQALSAGYVKLIDWKSIENANMATKEFKQQLIDTAVELGVVTKEGDMYTTSTGKSFNATKNFNDVLQEQWMTTDVLIKTLGKYADSNTEIGKKAFAAAQEVTKLTQMWDVLKETAQSGWARTWELIVGDLNSAKAIFTPLTNFFSGIIDAMSDARNRVLEIALHFSTPWASIADKLGNIKKAIKPIEDFADKLAYFQDIVDRVWMGEFNNWGDDPDRRDLLSQAGYDHRVVQELVNLGEKAWQSGQVYKLSVEEVEAAHKKFGLTMGSTAKETEQVTDAYNALAYEKEVLSTLTEDELALYRALEKEADRLGISVSELADEMSKNNGRDMLVDSFKNIGGAIVDMGNAIKSAWINIFNPPSVEVIGVRLYGIIRSLKDFTESLRLTDEKTGELNETGLKFQSVFKGIFAAIDIVLTVVGGPMKIVFKAATQLLSYFGLCILDVAAFVGDAIVVFRDWVDGVLDFTKVFEKIIPPIQNAIDTFRTWIGTLRESENLPQDIATGIASAFGKAVDAIKNFFKKIPEFFTNGFDAFGDSPIMGWVESIRSGLGVAGQTIAILGGMIREKINEFLSRSEFAGISADSIAGLIQGFKDGASNVWNAAVAMVSSLVEKVKSFLGIHSPSTVFAAIGGFIIAGLVAGLQNGIPDSLGAIKDVFQPMLDWIKGIDFGAVLAGVMGVGITATAYKTSKAIAAPLEGVGAMLGGLGEVFEGTGKVLVKSARPIAKVIKNTAKVVKSFSKVLNGVAFNMKAEGIKTLAETLLMLVGAIIVLTFFDPLDLLAAVGIVTLLAGVLVGLAFATSKISNASAIIGKEGINLQGLSTGLIGIGAAILLLAVTVKMLGSLDPEQAKRGFLGIAGLVLAIAAVVAAFGLLVKGPAAANIDKFGMTMTKLAVALLVMALVVKVLGGMDQSTLIQGGIAITAFVGILVGLMAATKLISGSKNVGTIGKTLLNIALAIGVMAIVAKMLGDMDSDTLIQGGIAITAFAGIMVGLMAATKLITGSKHVDKIGGTLLKIALAIGVMALVAKLLSGMEPADLAKGMLAITAFGGIIVGLMAATKLITGSTNIAKIGGALIGVSGAIAIMALTAFMLSMISWEGFAKGTIMVTAFAGIIVGLIAATKLVGKDADKISKTIITIAAAIGAIGLIAVLLSLVPTENLVKGLAAVTALSAVMAGLIAVTYLAKNCMGNIIALTVAIAVLAGALYLVSLIPAESLLPSAIALGSLMAVMAGVLAVMALVGPMAKSALQGALALAALAVPLALFGLVLAMMSALKVTDAIPNAIALSALCTVLTTMLIPLSAIGLLMTATGGTILLGVVALAAMAVPLALFVGIIALMSGIQNGIANATALAGLMAILGDVLFKISLVAPLAVVGVSAVNSMIGLMTALGVLAGLLGAFITPEIEAFIDKGIGILEKLASGLGSIIASFITGFAGEVMTLLPELGTCLSAFMTNVMTFVNGAKQIDEKVLAGVGILTAAILAFTVAELVSGLAAMAGLGLVALGLELSAFMVALKPFIAGASMISPESMNGIKSLAEAILILTAANVIDGLASLFGGESSLANFASQLPILGKGLADFSSNIGTFAEDQVTTVNCAANAIKTLASAAAEIPNTGGLLASIVGENDLSTFAAQFPILGSGLALFLSNIGTFTDEQVATVNCASQAIKTLAQASSEIPNSGGWVGAIVGENDMNAFAAQFPILGSGLAQFVTNIGTFTDEQVATVDCAGNAIKSLAQAAASIPNSGGWIAAIVGENDLGTFAAQFPKLGEGLAGFVDKLGTFTGDQVSTVNSAVVAINALSDLANADLKGATKHLGDFSSDLPDFGEDIGTFCESMPSSESITTAVNSVKKILSVIDDIANANSGALATFASDLKKIGEKAVDKFVSAFTSNSAKTDLKEAAKALGDQVVDGIEAKEKAIKNAAKSAAGEAVDGVETQEDDMESAGKDLGSGLVSGINSKKTAAYNAGYALGQMAVQGEKDGQQSKSPSKLTMLAGKWLGEGLIIGMGQMGNKVYKAGSTLGETATDTISSSISSIANMVGSDIDAQPTIRPVLDLSDVKSGASALSSMLNMDSSVGVHANLGAISSMMSGRNQNGSTSDIVSAIDKLNKKMDGLGTTTYQINGVTYDDGSNISDAVRTIVRAAVMERRI